MVYVGRVIMGNGRREENIRRIIDMEDRIAQCQRCQKVQLCVRKPSMGKGELEPDVMMIFECEDNLARNMDQIIEMRKMVKSSFKLDRMYHTYLVRCTPRACPIRSNISCYTKTKILDKDYNCLLSNRPCEGISVRPDHLEIIGCLPYLIEEIDILHPQYAILFGSRVSEFVLKCYGFFEEVQPGMDYVQNGIRFLPTKHEQLFNQQECDSLAERIHAYI